MMEVKLGNFDGFLQCPAGPGVLQSQSGTWQAAGAAVIKTRSSRLRSREDHPPIKSGSSC